MEDMIGGYEMPVIPITNFAPDGTPLLTTDKAGLLPLFKEP